MRPGRAGRRGRPLERQRQRRLGRAWSAARHLALNRRQRVWGCGVPALARRVSVAGSCRRLLRPWLGLLRPWLFGPRLGLFRPSGTRDAFPEAWEVALEEPGNFKYWGASRFAAAYR